MLAAAPAMSGPPVPPSDGPLDQTHARAVAAAAARAQPIRKAARVAAFNGWTMALMAALSAPFALFSVEGLLVFAGLVVVAYNEFRGRRRLLAFDPTATTMLGWNQLGLLAMITAYCLWALYSNLLGSNTLEAQLKASPELGAAFGSLGDMDGFDGLYRQIVVVLYGSVIALSAVFQGGNALYYYSRRKIVEDYVRETPEWVRDIQRAAGSQ
jgi:hypothetical protein